MERHTTKSVSGIPARDFLTDSECTIEIANIYTVRIRRVHDSILMEDAMTGNFTDGEIQAINRCRLYPSGRMSLRYLHSCRLDDRSRTATTAKGISQRSIKGLVKGFREALVGSVATVPQTVYT
jgi:hypothetical protein